MCLPRNGRYEVVLTASNAISKETASVDIVISDIPECYIRGVAIVGGMMEVISVSNVLFPFFSIYTSVIGNACRLMLAWRDSGIINETKFNVLFVYWFWDFALFIRDQTILFHWIHLGDPFPRNSLGGQAEFDLQCGKSTAISMEGESCAPEAFSI